MIRDPEVPEDGEAGGMPDAPPALPTGHTASRTPDHSGTKTLNGDAFAQRYHAYRPGLLHLCTTLLGDPQLAEDVVQETYLKASARLETFDPGRPVWPWVAAIARRVCLDVQRRRARDLLSDRDVITIDDYGEGDRVSLPASSDPVFDLVLQDQRRRRLERAVSILPPRQRRALLLYAEGWKYSEIASAEGVSVGAVKLLLVRARVRLRALGKRHFVEGLVPALPGLRLRRFLGRLQIQAQQFLERMSAIDPQAVILAVVAIGVMVQTTGNETDPIPKRVDSEGGVVLGFAKEMNSQPSIEPTRQISQMQTPVAGPAETGPQAIVERIMDPGANATPETTRFSSVSLSPGYASDRTVFAAGRCIQWPDCPVLFRSSDGGETWSRLPARGFAGHSVIISPGYSYSYDRTIYALSSLGLQESTDGGAIFRTVSPVDALQAAISPRFGLGDPRVLLIDRQTQGILVYRADTQILEPLAIGGLPLQRRFASIEFADSEEGPILFVGGFQLEPAYLISVLFRSILTRCAGSQCSDFETSPGSGVAAGIRMSPAFREDGKLTAFNTLFMFESSDKGYTFEERQLRQSPALVSDLAYRWQGQELQLVAASTFGKPGVFLSTDGGATWTRFQVSLPGFHYGVAQLAVAPDGRILALPDSGQLGIACSSDGGSTWFRRCSPGL